LTKLKKSRKKENENENKEVDNGKRARESYIEKKTEKKKS